MLTLGVSMLSLASTANAAPLPDPNLVFDGSGYTAYVKNFPSGDNEQPVFLDGCTKNDGCTSLTGHVGSQTGVPLLTFTTSTSEALTAGDGLATIKGAPLGDTGQTAGYSNLTATLQSGSMTDFVFSVNLIPSYASFFDQLLVTVFNNGTKLDNGFSVTPLTGGFTNGQMDIMVLADPGIVFNGVSWAAYNSSGALSTVIDQSKQVYVSGIGIAEVPIPPAALLFGTALSGVGFLSRRKKA